MNIASTAILLLTSACLATAAPNRLQIGVHSPAHFDSDSSHLTAKYDWAHPRQDWPGWFSVHQWYVDDANAAREKDGIQLLFYGDSITQCWRFGAEDNALQQRQQGNSICWGAPNVFANHFGSKYNAKVFGIGGDQTPELMYRLLHGEGPEGLNTTVAVLLIGTNDLGYALDKGKDYMDSIVPSVADHIKQITEYLTHRVQHVVLLGIFHRGNWHAPDTMFVQPSDFTDAINTINGELESFAEGQEQVHYLYCGDMYFTANHTMINKDLMPDALHPNQAGFELLAECLDKPIEKLMAAGQSQVDAARFK